MAPWTMDVIDLIGRTPLLELKRVTSDAHATVLAKLEMFSPGGSSKDRVAFMSSQLTRAQAVAIQREANTFLKQHPPLMNSETTPMAQSMGVLKMMRDRQSVASQLNTFTAEGRAISMVPTANAMARYGLMPLTNMWWP